MAKLEITDLHVSVQTDAGPKQILKGVNLTINDGEVHAIMGPNGSGKSTLAYTLAGHPKYTVDSGSVTLDGRDVLAMSVDERAKAGLFLAMQYPVEVPGVSVANFLRTAKTAIDGKAPSIRTWVKQVNEAMGKMDLDPTFGQRSVNEGFSGGEKKRHEIAQLELLNPKVAILDETDSGLDIDAAGGLRGRQPVRGPGEPRRPADHPLHADPELHQARLRPRVRRRPPGRQRRPGAGRRTRGRGLRQVRQGSEGGCAVTLAADKTSAGYDVAALRADFPILRREVNGKPIVYLDSANTSQKPQVVIDALTEHYTHHNANVARAMHLLGGAEATEAFEGGARQKLATFVGAARPPEEIVFTKNASEALNLTAHTLGADLKPGDEIVTTVMEHHSNIVPWQMLAERTGGATLRWFDITEDGRLDLAAAERDGLINEKTRIVTLTLVSNVLGTINRCGRSPIRPTRWVRRWSWTRPRGVPQMPVDMAALGADLVAFTGHKMVGPTGVGGAVGQL